MRLATFTLATAMVLGMVTAAAAQTRRAVVWQTTPGAVVGGGITTPYYGYQPHWIYGYMPYGYDAYPYGYGAYGLHGAYGGFGLNPYLAAPYGTFPYRSTYPAPVNDYGPPARSRSSLYPAIPYSEFAAQEQQQASEGRGYLNVQAPTADAKVWINDQLMTQSGRERSFMTPVLGSTTRSYTFDIKVSWTDDLGPRTQQTTLQVRAGDTKTVSFPLQAK